MVISGGNFKPDTLKPKEVVSLLLDDEVKIKGTIEDLKLKKLKKRKNDHKNISRTFSGFVVSIVGSVHFCTGSISRSGRSPGVGNGNPLQYSCLENPGTEEPGGLPSMGSHRDGHD